MQNSRLDEAQAGIKISGRNINNLRYTEDTTLMAESEEEEKRKKSYCPKKQEHPRNVKNLPLEKDNYTDC